MVEKIKGYNSDKLIFDELHAYNEIGPEVQQKVQYPVEERLEPIREPQSLPKYQEPYMYPIPAEANSGLPGVQCTCGWSKRSMSIKILQIAAWKHFDKTGHRRQP